MRFSARKRRRRPRKRQIVKAYIHQKIEPCFYLLQYVTPYHFVLFRQLKPVDKGNDICNRHFRKIRYIDTANCYGKHLWFEPLASALAAYIHFHIFFYFFLEKFRTRISVPSLEICQYALVNMFALLQLAVTGHIFVFQFSCPCAVEKFL